MTFNILEIMFKETICPTFLALSCSRQSLYMFTLNINSNLYPQFGLMMLLALSMSFSFSFHFQAGFYRKSIIDILFMDVQHFFCV